MSTLKRNKKKAPGDPPSEHLARPDVLPAEEFAGFDEFGEDPEWRPGERESRERTEAPDRDKNYRPGGHK
jgi:hypothetical protein